MFNSRLDVLIFVGGCYLFFTQRPTLIQRCLLWTISKYRILKMIQGFLVKNNSYLSYYKSKAWCSIIFSDCILSEE